MGKEVTGGEEEEEIYANRLNGEKSQCDCSQMRMGILIWQFITFGGLQFASAGAYGLGAHTFVYSGLYILGSSTFAIRCTGTLCVHLYVCVPS